MSSGASNNTSTPPPKPRTPATLLEAIQTHAYSQPTPIQSPFPAPYGPGFSSSPSPGIHAPVPHVPTPDNEHALAALNFYAAGGALPQNGTYGTILPMITNPIPPPVAITEEASKTKPAPEEKKKPAAVRSKAAPAKGKGSRSGKNARAAGHSDSEIEVLDEKTKKEAELVIPPKKASWTDDQALKLVEFVTAAERWTKVSTSFNKISQEAAQILFKDEFTPAQIVTKWQKILRTYKETRKSLNHTGGGDGDELFRNELQRSEKGTDDEQEDEGEKGKPVQAPKDLGRRCTPKQIEAFAASPIYARLVEVAEGRVDIDRAIEFSSHRKTEEINEDLKKSMKKRKNRESDEFGEVLSDALRSMKETQVQTLEYQRQRDDRLQNQEAERIQLEREKLQCEKETAELRKKSELEDLRFRKMERYRAMRDSTDPLERAMAKRLAEEISREQGLDM